MARSMSASILGRPSCFPSLLARRRPARTRSWSMARSNSANTPIIWNIALPTGRGGVEALLVQEQIDVQCMQLGQERHQVLQTATKAIDAPGHHDIELAPCCGLAERIELQAVPTQNSESQEILEFFQYYRRTEGSSSSLPPLPSFRKWRDEFHSLALGLIQP